MRRLATIPSRMPEGPEIRRAAARIDRVLAGRTVEHAELTQPHLRRLAASLIGQQVDLVTSRGKAMLIRFADGRTLYSHNQLYGVWRLCKRGKLPKTKRQLRLALHTATDSALLYSASDISVWRQEELHQHPFLARIGPDILSSTLTWQDLASRLQSSQFSGRSLAALYLDQQFLAGIGNYLRSEILFAAAVDPAARPKDLTRAQINTLARQTLGVSRRSYRSGGVTLTDKQYRWLRDQDLSYEEARFMVFGRRDLPCHVCGTKIKRTQAGARRLYSCANCQAIG